jgi:hypothetical protein
MRITGDADTALAKRTELLRPDGSVTLGHTE